MNSGDEDRIRARAYEIWERKGRPEGREQEHWDDAKREIEGEGSGSAGSDAEGLTGGSLGAARMPKAKKGQGVKAATPKAGVATGLQAGGVSPAGGPGEGTSGSAKAKGTKSSAKAKGTKT